MDTVTRVQILNGADSISHSTNTLVKGSECNYSPSSNGLIVGQTGLFSSDKANSLGERRL